MEDREFKNIFQNESSHYYYTDTHEMIGDLVRRYGPSGGKSIILDAGCGTGLLGIKLQAFGKVIGVDINAVALQHAKQRGLAACRASLARLPFKTNMFDIAVCVDVLYHKQIVDDQKAINELYRVLKPGGVLVLRVPAIPWLLRAHDAYVYTRVRYSKADLNKKLRKAKFIIVKTSFVHGALFVLAFGIYVLEKFVPVVHPTSNVFPLPKLFNAALLSVLRIERRIFRFIDMPIGLGLVAIAQKRS